MKYPSSFKKSMTTLLAAILVAVGAAACTPTITNNTQPTVNTSPQAPGANSNNTAGQPTVTVTPSPNLPSQPVVGPASPPVVTPVPVPPITNTPGSYPNSYLLVDTKWMAGHIADQNLVIIDTRPASNYASGHINGAINIIPGTLDNTNAAKDASVLKSAAELSEIFGKAGVSNTDRIIVYGSGIDANAGRVFWALEYLGHKDLHILDGGYDKWNKEGNYAVTYNSVRTATTFATAPNPGVITTKADMLASINNTNVVRVDSRNPADFVAKRIPNSINILVNDYLSADGSVKPLTELTSFLNAKGITPGKTVITNCYVGYRSAQAYFIFRLMGYNVSNYDGSTTEWFADPALPTQP